MPTLNYNAPFVLSAYSMSLRRKKNLTCHKCLIEFKVGDMVKEGGRKGKQRLYHKECYKEY